MKRSRKVHEDSTLSVVRLLLREACPIERMHGEYGVACKGHAYLVLRNRHNCCSVGGRTTGIEYQSTTFSATKQTGLTLCSKRKYRKLLLSNVSSALGNRYMRPSVARKDIATKSRLLMLRVTSEQYSIFGSEREYGFRISDVLIWASKALRVTQLGQLEYVKMRVRYVRFAVQTFKICPIAAWINMVSPLCLIFVCGTVWCHFSYCSEVEQYNFVRVTDFLQNSNHIKVTNTEKVLPRFDDWMPQRYKGQGSKSRPSSGADTMLPIVF